MEQTVVQLKATAYDILAQIQYLQQQLKQVNDAIAAAQNPVPAPAVEVSAEAPVAADPAPATDAPAAV